MIHPKKNRKLRFEHLENRELFNRDEIAFVGFGSLTFSIAPDGTRVGNEVSSLQGEFNQIAAAEKWQAAIARAFQKWSIHTNINIGNVADNGAASGVYGPTRGDERFGDIRLTGYDYTTDTFAEAVSENARSVGAWAGDVFFNTAVKWNSVDDIEAAAIHEVGHILGLGHSSDPASPMYTHGPSGALELTAQDVLDVQAIHGNRNPDSNEGARGNNTIADASRIKGDDNDTTVIDGFRGDQVWIQFGDLQNADDRDVYELRTAINYSGPMSIEVRTLGLSLARLTAEITDRDGRVLLQQDVSGQFGGVSVLTLDKTAPASKYYLQVRSSADRFWAMGDYSITVASPSRLQADANAIADWARNAHRWYQDSDRTKDGFSFHLEPNSSHGPESNDDHSDDTSGRSVPLPLVAITETRTVRRTVGTISDLIDIDHYQVMAPKVLNGQNELVIDLESLQVEGLVPQIKLSDKHGTLLSPEVRVQGFGQTQLVLSNVQPEQEFVIELKAGAVSDEYKTGSFSLTATFSFASTPPELLAEGTVAAGSATFEREWYVARPQLFGFSLIGTTQSSKIEGQVWVSIFDSQRKLVTGLVAPLNSLRSAPGLFLNPGTYFFQIAAAVTGGPTDVQFRFMVDRPSDAIGPLLGGIGVQPIFLCPGSTTEYCYPNSQTPTVQTQKVGPQPTVALPPPTTQPVAKSPNDWFWTNNFLPTNPSNALDSTGDGTVNPLDVLIIINAINSIGFGPVPSPPQFLGHIDTNANGVLDPLDALIVINYLNSLEPEPPNTNV